MSRAIMVRYLPPTTCKPARLKAHSDGISVTVNVTDVQYALKVFLKKFDWPGKTYIGHALPADCEDYWIWFEEEDGHKVETQP